MAKRLSLANVKPAGTCSGHPVYKLSDAVPAILGMHNGGDPDDPRTLPPEKRRAWYQSERVRVELEVSNGKLIPVAEVEMAEFVKRAVQFLQTLPDILERDAGLTPEQVQRTQDCIDRLRGQMYEAQVAESLLG